MTLPKGYRFRGLGKAWTATKTITNNLQFKLTEERAIDRIQLILKDHVDGDKVHFEIVDVDNVLGYGAGVVLDRFGEDWYMDESIANQGIIDVGYYANVYANLYIRVVYVSIGTVNDVNVKCNFWLHKPPT